MGHLKHLHNKENKIELDLYESLKDNCDQFEVFFKDCDDVVKRRFQIGDENKHWAFISYIDVMIDRRVIEESVLEQLIEHIQMIPGNVSAKENVFEYIKNQVLATADVKEITDFDQLCLAVLSGDTILLVDGFSKGLLIATRGWPNRGVQEPDTEGVVRGSKEGFSEPMRFNTVLIRRRIRDTRLKIKQAQVGTRSRTDIAIIFMEDLVREDLLKEINERISGFSVDGIFESGMLEELMLEEWKSPFPKMQVTQRPDKVASALLEGRVAIVVDNTPFVLLMPTTLNCFFQAAEDYYQSWVFASLTRLLRYVSAFFAAALPGLYIALTCYHPAMIPTALVHSIAASRNGVPFPTIIEVLIIELEFEFLREAGVRLPGSLGSTISIVGGLVIGQAVVAANLVSPIIIVVVSITAIASFSIPTYTLTNTFRLIKYVIILASGLFGLYGFWLCIILILVHLVSLKSFHFPYLMPFVSADMNGYNDLKDSLFRLPAFLYRVRPIFTRKGARIKFRSKKG